MCSPFLPSSRVASSHRISVASSPFNLLSMPHRPSFGSLHYGIWKPTENKRKPAGPGLPLPSARSLRAPPASRPILPLVLLVLRAPARALSLVLSARDAATEPVPDQYRTQGSKQRNKTYTNLTSLTFRHCRCLIWRIVVHNSVCVHLCEFFKFWVGPSRL